MSDIFAKVQQVIEEIESAKPSTKEEIEQFRLKYIGTKNIIKPLFGEIGQVENARKKEFGQLVNAFKISTRASPHINAITIDFSHKRKMLVGKS